MLISLTVLMVSSTVNIVQADDYFWGFYNRISKDWQANEIGSSIENSSFDDSKHKGTYFWGEFDNLSSTQKIATDDDIKLKTGYFWSQFNN